MKAREESQLSAGPGKSQRMVVSRWRWRAGAALALACGAGLRLWMMKAVPQVEGDTLLYGNLAKGLLLHGRFAMADGSGVLHETLIRLPGYPLFLAACFGLFGVDNYLSLIHI